VSVTVFLRRGSVRSRRNAAATPHAPIADDPGEFVDPVRAKGERQGKRLFKLEQLRVLLEVADPEWRSMILFGLYTGQRLGDIARLTWANLDLPGQRLRLTT
jgi:integrase